MKILLLGGSGQLGSQFLLLKDIFNFEFITPLSKELDITNIKNLEGFFKEHSFDLVLNFSAFTNVDNAEDNLNLALELNYLAIKNLTSITNFYDKPLIHISTDYVFGKYGSAPFDIGSKAGALNNYGFSKLLGEEEIINHSHKAIIIRTASLYGNYKKNFFKTFIDILTTKKTIDIVSDQRISLTWSYDLSIAIFELLELISNSISWNKNKSVNIIHLVNEGHTTWYEVAKVISSNINQINNYNNPSIVNPILYSDWTSKTKRPMDSRLSFNGKIPNLGLLKMPKWQPSLIKAIKIYLKGRDFE